LKLTARSQSVGLGLALVLSGLLATSCQDTAETDGGTDAGGTPDGAMTDGAMTDGAVTDGAVTDSAVTDSAVTDSAVTDGAVTDGAVTDSALTDGATADAGDTTAPTVVVVPADGAPAFPTNRTVSALFSEAMNPTTLTTASFQLTGPGASAIDGAVTVTASGLRAVFNPLADLDPDTRYEARITTGAEDPAGNALASDFVWTFRTGLDLSLGPDPVLLGGAGNYVILAKSGIDTVPTSAIVGNIGVSPIDSTAVTGFSLTLDATNRFATSSQVTGQVRAADYATPTPSNLTTAVGAMESAYTDAAGRSIPDFTELGSGEIGGRTLVPGLYKWGTGVSISTDVVLHGGPNDVWIFQISGDITQANGTRVTLTGGASPANVFWQTFGQTMIGTTAHFEGIVLCQTAIVVGTGASVNGRLLAQTAVTLDANAITQPAM